MKIRIDMDHAGFKKGEEKEVSDAEGCALVGQGVASVLEPTRPKRREPKGEMRAEFADKEESGDSNGAVDKRKNPRG